MNSMRGAFRGRMAVVGVVGTVLAGIGLGATPAAAQEQPAPPPVVVGTNGQRGTITVQAMSPGSSGGGLSTPADHVGSSNTAAGGGGGAAGGGGGGGAPASPGRALTPAELLAAQAQQASAILKNPANKCVVGPTSITCQPPPAPPAPAAPAAPGAPAPPANPAPPPPPPDPAVVAQLAIKQLNLQAGAPRLSANPRTAVGLPVWMWVDGGAGATGPLTATAKAGPTSVTATATLDRIEWSMGPGGATILCHGRGTPAPVNTPLYAGQDSPTCGYTYTLRSLPERTGGTGRWPVTATSVWRITWAGGGQTGAQDLPLTAGTDVEVGELQAVVTGGS